MDLDKYLKSVTNYNEYTSLSCDLDSKRIILKIPLNISTVLSLKKIKSFEIEYFNKCDENGAALKVFEYLLRSPPSKMWSMLGADLIYLLQYWLEAMRKHLITHNAHWWTFLEHILKFIKDLQAKDASLNKILIEGTGECLLDLATHSVPDIYQRDQIIQCFNHISAESSRNIRLAYRDIFQKFFVKLAALLAGAGDFPLQSRALEALVRWLLPRQEGRVRRAAAAAWFPDRLYSGAAVRVFLERPWRSFVEDARDFLNAQNESSRLVTSVVCRRLKVGANVIYSGERAARAQCWLDVNSSSGGVSVALPPAAGGGDALVVTDRNATSVELKRERQRTLLTIAVASESLVYPHSRDAVRGDHADPGLVVVSVSTGSDLARLDGALRGVFGDKYQFQSTSEVENSGVCASPNDEVNNSDVINGTAEEVKFSMPRLAHTGYISRTINAGAFNSPSSISTTSLAQLHEKLNDLPQYTFDKEPVSVCAFPQLSTVTEVSETDDIHTRNSSLSTVKLATYGFCNEILINKSKKSSTSIEIGNGIKNISPVVNNNENSVSLLLVTTIGSSNDSTINDIVNCLPKNVPCNTNNIVDLLAQEALRENVTHIGQVNTEENQNISEINERNYCRLQKSTCEIEKPTEISPKSQLRNEQQAKDESSIEIVENTPMNWVQVRPQRKIEENNNWPVDISHDVEAVENFFSQHFKENKNGDLIISPSLAKKINETSSESSEGDLCMSPSNYIVQDNIEIDEPFVQFSDIVECVNSMVDKVCRILDKCSKNRDLYEESIVDDNSVSKSDPKNKSITKKNSKKQENTTTQVNAAKQKGKQVKLKFTKNNSLSRKTTMKTTRKPIKLFQIMSPIIERESVSGENAVNSPKTDETMLRRKRKLYSPKNDDCHEKTHVDINEFPEDKTTTKLETKAFIKTQKSNNQSIATPYKELEQAGKKRIRRPRVSLKKSDGLSSPRTMKNNQIFDSLKNVVDGEPVTLVDKTIPIKDIVYNFSSDSENEVAQKVNLSLKKNSSPAEIGVGTKSTRRSNKKGSAKAAPVLNNLNEVKVKVDTKRKPNLRTKRTKSKSKNENVVTIPKPYIEDQHMRRELPEILNTSLVIEHSKEQNKSAEKQPDPVLNIVPQLEPITADTCKSDDSDRKTKENQHKSKTKKILSLKRNKEPQKVNLSIAENDGTMSPLPGLVVETVLTTDFDVNDSVTANMLEKFKSIMTYQGNAVTDTEMNTTHNLLSESNEQVNYSVSNLNITEELNRHVDKRLGDSNKVVIKDIKKKRVTKRNVNKTDAATINVDRKNQKAKTQAKEKSEGSQRSVVEVDSERTMATMGNSHSPITGHGDFDEDPPDSGLLNQHIPHRVVQEEYLNGSLKDYFDKLTEQLNEQSRMDCVESDGASEPDPSVNDRSSSKSGNTSPVVLISRLSPEYIKQITSNSHSINTNKSKTVPASCGGKETDKRHKGYSRSEDRYSVEESRSPDGNTTQLPRRSVISPIKMFDDMIYKKAKTITSAASESDDGSRNVKKTSSRTQGAIKSNLYQIGAMETRSRSKARLNLATSSPISRRSVEESDGKASVASKRKLSPILRTAKSSRREEVNNNFGSSIDQSGPSLSSVDEWFKRNESTQRADNIKLGIKEYTNNLLEKIDTTLVEIHHDTSKRFVSMFVAATAQLSDMQQKWEQMQRRATEEIAASVARIAHAKCAELNNSFRSMGDQFMEDFKRRAHELVREECSRKRAMVTLLREDAQAVIDHLERDGGTR